DGNAPWFKESYDDSLMSSLSHLRVVKAISLLMNWDKQYIDFKYSGDWYVNDRDLLPTEWKLKAKAFGERVDRNNLKELVHEMEPILKKISDLQKAHFFALAVRYLAPNSGPDKN